MDQIRETNERLTFQSPESKRANSGTLNCQKTLGKGSQFFQLYFVDLEVFWVYFLRPRENKKAGT